jgi:hypothetical protein
VISAEANLRSHLEELRRRFPGAYAPIVKTYDFTDYNFKRQAEILADKSRFQAWLFTRRFGKSVTFAKKACNVAANNAGSKVLYLALTLQSAKGILWDIVESELKSQGIKFRAYENEGEFCLDNGSIIKFFGVDSNYKEMKKILGQAYDLVGIDESGSMTIDMETLVMQMILAALTDREGTLVLLGTAENIPNTYYQKVTEGQEKSLPWSIHKGHTEESPYTGEKFRRDKEMILSNNPNAIKTSWFKTHWLNEWCADDDLLIIHFNKQLNRVDKLPDYKDWIFGLGVDLGFNDASSFTVDAISSKSPYLYRVKSFKSPGLDFTGVAKIIKQLNDEYGFTFAEVDGANKQGVQEMQNRHDLGITLHAAEKSDKPTYLRLMGDDYKEGKIKHVGEGCVALEDEQSKLMWIKDSDKEDPRCQNHCNDGGLYIWRKMRNYFKAESSEWKSPNQKMEELFLKESREALDEEDELSLLF